MKFIKIEKKDWGAGLQKSSETYRLFGPQKEEEFHNFRELEKGVEPDLSCLNTRLSPKSLI